MGPEKGKTPGVNVFTERGCLGSENRGDFRGEKSTEREKGKIKKGKLT